MPEVADFTPASAAGPNVAVTRDAWLALAVSTLVTFLVVIDISAVNVAFPSIRDDFDVSDTGLSWVVSGYTAAAVSILTGRSADRYGHRWLLGVGCILCAVGYGLYTFILGDEPRVFTLFVPLGIITGVGIGLTVATWSSAGLSDIPQANFGVASATYGTLRQAAYGLGVAVVIALIAHGAGDDIDTFRPAWAFSAACYLLAGLSVMLTFPSGSSHDRGLVTDTAPGVD